MKNFGLVLIAALVGGCGTQKYGFRPVANVASAEAGYPAARYAVPPESPRGEVYVTSFGTRDVDAGGGARSQLIHVRLAVANQSGDTDWTVDPRKQTIVGPGGAPQSPDFMEVDGKHDGNTSVSRGQKRVFDFYYRVPGGGQNVSQVGGFELQWTLEGGGQTFAERTPFVREPYRDYGGDAPRTNVAVGVVASPWWAYGWGPAWWGGFGWGYSGPWGYPYYGYGPYVGVGIYGGRGGYRHSYGGGRYGGGYGGGTYGGGGGRGRIGGGGGSIRAPAVRGR